jgi:branched-chain amino acid transport system substrate-binding protein
MISRVTLSMSACITLLIACSSSSGNGESPIVIAGIFGITGPLAPFDVPGANGAKLAADQINAAGGVNGRKISFSVQDYKSDVPTAVSLAKHVTVDLNADAVVGFADPAAAIPAGEQVQSARRVFITYGATTPTIPATIGDLAFLSCFGDNVQASAAAEFSLRKFGNTAAVIWDNSAAYTQGLRNYFTSTFKTIGGMVLTDQPFDGSMVTDLSPYIAAIKALPTAPSFIYLPVAPPGPSPEQAVMQLRAQGLTMPIIGADAYADGTLPTMIGSAANNVYYTTHAWLDPGTADTTTKAFITAYTAKYHNAPENVFAALGYDTVKLIADAIGRAGSTQPDPLKTALGSTSMFAGVTGLISYKAPSRVPLKGVTVVAIQSQTATLSDEFVPQHVPAP